MVGPILLGIALLLFACLIAMYRLQKDGFTDASGNDASGNSICSPIKVAVACDNTADCNWDKTTSKCYSCAELTACGSCVDNNKCGWCADIKKCVMSDRMGLPLGKACSDTNFAVTPDMCTAKRQPTFNASSDFKDDLIDTNLIVTESQASTCANEGKVVDIVKGRLSNDIKALVRAELTANKITPVEGFEGFQNLERTIANSTLASISDDVRAMVKKSLPKKL